MTQPITTPPAGGYTPTPAERADQLRNDLLTATIAYAGATQEYGEASATRVHADERVRLLDVVADRFRTVLHLAGELAALAASGGAR